MTRLNAGFSRKVGEPNRHQVQFGILRTRVIATHDSAHTHRRHVPANKPKAYPSTWICTK